MLTIDHGGHGALLLGDSARAVLKGEQPITLRRQATKPSKSGDRAGRGTRTDHAASMDEDTLANWEALRRWRTATAKEHGVPAYVIFHDATLAELARSDRRVGELTRLTGDPQNLVDLFILKKKTDKLLEVARNLAHKDQEKELIEVAAVGYRHYFEELDRLTRDSTLPPSASRIAEIADRHKVGFV